MAQHSYKIPSTATKVAGWKIWFMNKNLTVAGEGLVAFVNHLNNQNAIFFTID